MLYRFFIGKKHARGNFPGSFVLKCVLFGCTALLSSASASAQGPPDRGGSISGTVLLDGAKRPSSQVVVSLRSTTTDVTRRILTDRDGRFEVSGLPAGSYELLVEEPGYSAEPTSARVESQGASSVTLRIHTNAPAGLPSANAVSVRELKMPEKARNEFLKGLDVFARDQYLESLRHFTKATEAFPGYYEAFHFIGVSEMKLGELEKAMQAFQRAIDLSNGRYAEAFFGMGYTSFLQGKLEEAETILRRGLDVDSNAPEGYFYLGMTLFLRNKVEEAESTAHKALQCKPDYAAAYIVLANVYGRRHDFQKQLEALDTYLKLSPDGPSAPRVREVRDVTRGILAGLKPAN